MSAQVEEAKVWCGPGKRQGPSFSLETNMRFQTNLF